MVREFGVLCFVLYAFGIRVNEAAVFTSEFEGELQLFIEKTIQCRHVPGLTLTVVKGKLRHLNILSLQKS